jgi:hypothetical protein
MISDVLSDASSDLDDYLADDFYDDETKERVRRVQAVMNAMQGELDDRAGAPRPIVDILMQIPEADPQFGAAWLRKRREEWRRQHA